MKRHTNWLIFGSGMSALVLAERLGQFGGAGHRLQADLV